MPAGLGQAQLVMGMPFPDVHQAELCYEDIADGLEVVNILVEKCNLMVGSGSRSNGIDNNWGATARPETEELSTSLDIGALEDAFPDEVHLTAIDVGSVRDLWLGPYGGKLGLWLRDSRLLASYCFIGLSRVPIRRHPCTLVNNNNSIADNKSDSAWGVSFIHK